MDSIAVSSTTRPTVRALRDEQIELRAQIADIQQKCKYLIDREGVQAAQLADILTRQARIEGYLTKIIEQNDNLYKALFPAGA